MPIRVVQFGLGPIGMAVVRRVAARKDLKLVGAVDVDPAKVGRDLGELAEVGRKLGVKVSADADAVLKSSKPDVVLHTTGSSLRKVVDQLYAVFARKVPVVSTTEELSFPWYSQAVLAKKIDAAARKAKVAVLGTGVNPGFTMDALPIMLSVVCERVDSVFINRIQDASIRRLPFQKKIGAGLTPMQFQERVDGGTVRHVGLTESIAMIAAAFGWKLDRVTDEIGPKVATKRVSSQFLTVEPGQVCGLIQEGTGFVGGKPLIRLHMEAYLGAPESYDSVTIEGSPRIEEKISGGIHGDVATVSMVVNSIPKVLAASPGLHTMRDLALPSYFPLK